MYTRLIIALAVVVFFAITHWQVYRFGRKTVETQYQTQVLLAEKKARETEQLLSTQKQKAEELYVKQKRQATAAAANARAELDRLRAALAGSSGPTSDPTPNPGVDGRAGPESELFGQCAAALVSMAAETDRLKANVVGLQEYVKNVCTPQNPVQSKNH